MSLRTIIALAGTILCAGPAWAAQVKVYDPAMCQIWFDDDPSIDKQFIHLEPQALVLGSQLLNAHATWVYCPIVRNRIVSDRTTVKLHAGPMVACKLALHTKKGALIRETRQLNPSTSSFAWLEWKDFDTSGPAGNSLHLRCELRPLTFANAVGEYLVSEE